MFKGWHDYRYKEIQGITRSKQVASCLNGSRHKKVNDVRDNFEAEH